MPEKHLPIATLADVYARFAPLSVEESGPVRRVRGPALAMAQDWVLFIPAGPKREAALERLNEAAELAVDALYPAGACS
jgi:hypothetical protein